MHIRVVSAIQKIDNLEAKAKSAPTCEDAELQANIARFLCVLTSGLIERAVSLTLEEHLKTRCHPRIARYVSHHLARFNNAKFKDILVIASRFEPAWRDYLETNTTAEIQDAIDSIVNNKNQTAHGHDSGVSLVTFSRYYKCVKVFIADFDAFISVQ